MDFWKDNTIVIAAFLCLALLVSLFMPGRAQASASERKVGDSGTGTVYLLTESVQPVQKDGSRYLVAAAEEVYTDADFLADLHSDESTRDAASELTLYMFTSDGRYYCIVQRYLLDSEGRTCADLGGDMQLQMIGDKLTADIYTAALDVLKEQS